MKINLIGTIFGTSGYSNHTRNLFNALVKEGHDVKLDTSLIRGWELQVKDAELQAITKPAHKDGVTVIIDMPHKWQKALNEYMHTPFFGYLIWEGNRIPACWVDPLHKVDGIIVPSMHVKEAIKASIDDQKVLQKVHIVPHGVTDDFKVLPKPKEFTFIANKGWCMGEYDRGGIQFLLRAYTEEFKKDEPVVLKIKINPAYNNPGWNFQKEVEKLQLPGDFPQLYVTSEELPAEALPQFYQGHVFVSPTMAEAFSMPCLEAMRCGIPVITTDYGGQTDYVDDECGYLIKSQPYEVEHDWMYEGISWAKPDVEHLKHIMRYAYENQEECATKGQQAHAKSMKYSWQNSAQTLIGAINSSLSHNT